MNATLDGHLDRAAAVMRVLHKHGADLETITADVPKMIAIADDLHTVFKADEVATSTAAADATAPQTPAPAKKISASEAAAHVKANGLTAAQAKAFVPDRATQLSG